MLIEKYRISKAHIYSTIVQLHDPIKSCSQTTYTTKCAIDQVFAQKYLKKNNKKITAYLITLSSQFQTHSPYSLWSNLRRSRVHRYHTVTDVSYSGFVFAFLGALAHFLETAPDSRELGQAAFGLHECECVIDGMT